MLGLFTFTVPKQNVFVLETFVSRVCMYRYARFPSSDWGLGGVYKVLICLCGGCNFTLQISGGILVQLMLTDAWIFAVYFSIGYLEWRCGG